MYEILWTNFGHKVEQVFSSIDEAASHARKVCQEATILDYHTGDVVATWTVFGGLRHR